MRRPLAISLCRTADEAEHHSQKTVVESTLGRRQPETLSDIASTDSLVVGQGVGDRLASTYVQSLAAIARNCAAGRAAYLPREDFCARASDHKAN